MKLQIVSNGSTLYSGYTHVSFDNVTYEENSLSTPKAFNDISDNSCEQVVAYNLLSKYELSVIPEVVKCLVGKVRRGGTLSLDFLNYETFDLFMVDTKEFNDKLFRCKSALDLDFVKTLLERHGMKVITVEILGESNETTVVCERV